jgi:hydroxyethylthiazole kinase-like uncharacterized protein yjeF
MQRIMTPFQMRTLEERAFQLGVPSLLLMEDAARAAHQALKAVLVGVVGKSILYLVGSGNNGGDGLAMARLCSWDGGHPQVLLTTHPATKEAQANLAYAQALGFPICALTPEADLNLLPKPDAVVDAIFGTGFHRALPMELEGLARLVKGFKVPVIAVDAPSGMNSMNGEVLGGIFSATQTIALGHLKTGLCLTGHPEYAGELTAVPFGIPEAAWQALGEESIITALEPGDLRDRLPRRAKNTHKGDCGRLLLYMGNIGMAGAAAMAAQAALAALRVGAGLVTLACERELIPVLQTLVPNAMCIPVEQAVKQPPPCDVLALGCGLGKSETVWNNIMALWHSDRPSVWDADALNMLAEHPMPLGTNAVITPHPGEAARLLNLSTEAVISDLLASAEALRLKYGCTVVLKSAVSVIRDSERTMLNLVGSPVLARGGSGDALTGIIAGLMAQQRNQAPLDTAAAACLWFGLAAREAERRHGVLSALTGDVIECLSAVSN